MKGRGFSLPRRPLGIALAAGALAPPALGVGGIGSMVALMMFAGLISVALARGGTGRPTGLSALEWLPASLLFGLLPAMTLGMLGSYINLHLWNGHARALTVWALIVLATLAFTLRRSGNALLWPDRATAALVGLPLAAVVVPLAFNPFGVWARLVTAGTDFARHVLMADQVRLEGWLNYSGNPYPRSAHTTLALLQGASGDGTFTGAWQSAQALLLVMYALTISASGMLASRHLAALSAPSWVSTALAPLLTSLFLFAGPWLTGNLAFGLLTTIQAGLLLVAYALLLWEEPARLSRTTGVGLVLLCALVAHAHALILPIVALPTALVLVVQCRGNPRTAVPMGLAAAAALAIAVPVFLSTISVVGVGQAALPGGHALPMLGFAWGLLVATSCLSAWFLRRLSASSLAGSCYLLMITGLLAVVALLWPSSDGTRVGSYYLLKTAWTPIGLLLALAVPFVLLLALRAKRWLSVLISAALLAAALLMVPGSTVSLRIMSGDEGRPAIVVQVFEQLDPRLAQDNEARYLIWGLLPQVDADAASLSRMAKVDIDSQESLPMAGYPAADINEQLIAVSYHDAPRVCRLLQRYPDVIPITGPYPDGPLGWLRESGCPNEVIRPERWLSIDVPPDFLDGSDPDGVPTGSSFAPWSAVEPLLD